MNDLTIKNATEEQLKDMKLQIDKQLAELAKPKQYVFKEGDFRWSSQHNRYVWDGSSSRFNWLESFTTLSYHCLKLGGRVMSKPNENDALWWYPYYGFNSKVFCKTWAQDSSRGLFSFPSEQLCNQFLSTEGVQDHLYNFFQIER